jgi:hypothetical protein
MWRDLYDKTAEESNDDINSGWESKFSADIRNIGLCECQNLVENFCCGLQFPSYKVSYSEECSAFIVSHHCFCREDGKENCPFMENLEQDQLLCRLCNLPLLINDDTPEYQLCDCEYLGYYLTNQILPPYELSYSQQFNAYIISYHCHEYYPNLKYQDFNRYHYDKCSCCDMMYKIDDNEKDLNHSRLPFSLRYTSGKYQQQQYIKSFKYMRMILRRYGCPLDIENYIVLMWFKLLGGYRPVESDYVVHYVRPQQMRYMRYM